MNSCQQDLRRYRLGGIGIHNLDEYLTAICRAARDGVDSRNGSAFLRGIETGSAQCTGQSFPSEMRGVELVDQIGRRDKYSMSAGLDDPPAPSIDHVGDRTHLNYVARSLKNVHQTSSVYRRLHGVLSRKRQRGIPLVDCEFDVPTGHDLLYHSLHFSVEPLVVEWARP